MQDLQLYSYRNTCSTLSNSESFSEEEIHLDKKQSSSTIIFSLANSMIGPTIIIIPLSIAKIGLLTSVLIAVVICCISLRTCQLTHLHAKLTENEYFSTVKRIMGKSWMRLYSISSIIILCFASMIYFLSLADITYSSLKLFFNKVDWPSENKIDFSTFSYQYIGIMLMVLIGWLFFIPKLGKILDLTEKGIYSIIIEALFTIYLGIRAIVQGEAKIVFHTNSIEEEIGLFTSQSLTYTIGVFAMAFTVHNCIVEIIRKNKKQSNNARDVRYAYLITLFTYIITGTSGALGLYPKISSEPNTILNNELYNNNETLTFIFLLVTQIMTAFQLITVLPVINNVVRNQFFFLVFGEGKNPPKFAFITFNIIFILSLLVVQIFNISPSAVMSYGGALIGFVIIYLLPVTIHLKSIRAKQIQERQCYTALYGEYGLESFYNEVDIAKFLREKRRINYFFEYLFHGVILAVGMGILLSQGISLFQ